MDKYLKKKLKNMIIKSGLKKEEELKNASALKMQRIIRENFVQVKTCGFTERRHIYILKDQFEIIEKYNEVVE